MHKLQVMIICCPWIDHQSYCSIPTELCCDWLGDGKTQTLLTTVFTTVFSPFSGQFLTWSFFAPISCVALNGFHSCFLKPGPGPLLEWSQPVIDQSTRSRVWESGDTGDSHGATVVPSFYNESTSTLHWRKGEEKFHELHKGCWFINDNFTILYCVLL